MIILSFADHPEPTTDLIRLDSIGIGATSRDYAADLGITGPAAGLILEYTCGSDFCLTGHRSVAPIDARAAGSLLGMLNAWASKALTTPEKYQFAEAVYAAQAAWAETHKSVNLEDL